MIYKENLKKNSTKKELICVRKKKQHEEKNSFRQRRVQEISKAWNININLYLLKINELVQVLICDTIFYPYNVKGLYYLHQNVVEWQWSFKIVQPSWNLLSLKNECKRRMFNILYKWRDAFWDIKVQIYKSSRYHLDNILSLDWNGIGNLQLCTQSTTFIPQFHGSIQHHLCKNICS